MLTTKYERRSAVVCIQGWFGYHEYPVTVVGETAKRYRVVAGTSWQIRSRRIEANEQVLIPKYAVKF